MRLENAKVGGEEKALTHRAEQISIGSCLRSECGSCWSCFEGGRFGDGGVERDHERLRVRVLR